jgi:spore coat polysaccharide biosynthesis protein SpsF
MPKVIASIEARMGSTRLPGKVLADIVGKPALSRLLERLRLCQSIDDIVLATTTNPLDEQLIEWAESEGLEYYCGSEDNVLDRVVCAHEKMGSDIIVEICGDMILLDPEVVDLGVDTFLHNKCDVVTTTGKKSYPEGVDVVVFQLSDLQWINQNTASVEHQEHVSLYFFENDFKYTILNLMAPRCFQLPHWRLLLDYPEDLEAIREIYSALIKQLGPTFSLEHIVDYVKKSPTIKKIVTRVVD